MKSTTDHDTIKNWVKKWGGQPAVGTDTLDGDGKGILRINFSKGARGEPIGWDEFFDIFEADHLAFRYNDIAVKGSEELAFSFVDRSKQAPSTDDETSLPEENSMAEENMYDNFGVDQLD